MTEAPKLEIVREGVVVVRGVLSEEEQERVVQIVQRKGDLKDGENKWNFFGVRGRTFCALSDYSEEDEQYLRGLHERFRGQIPETACIPDSVATHLLTLWYPTSKGMGWHSDGYGGNNGDRDVPVCSLTVGNGCVFQWRSVAGGTDEKPTFGEIEQTQLNGGDLIVFGGCQRLMLHRVKRVIADSSPIGARVNLTFRRLAEFTAEDVQAFKTDTYAEREKKRWAAQSKSTRKKK